MLASVNSAGLVRLRHVLDLQRDRCRFGLRESPDELGAVLPPCLPAAQNQFCDLGRTPESIWRSKGARPPTHVELAAAGAEVARDPAVSEPNHPIPRPDLTTVSVARELEVDAQLAGVREGTRAMSEEDDRPARIAAPERAIETFFATLAAPQQMTSLVIDSGQIETALTRRDCNALVSQQAPTKFPTAIHPGLDAGIDFVIPGDEPHALWSLQRLQGFDLHSDVLDGSVHEISGYDHEVGLEQVDALRDPGSEAAAMYRADVKVRDLDDPVSIEACWPARE